MKLTKYGFRLQFIGFSSVLSGLGIIVSILGIIEGILAIVTSQLEQEIIQEHKNKEYLQPRKTSPALKK